MTDVETVISEKDRIRCKEKIKKTWSQRSSGDISKHIDVLLDRVLNPTINSLDRELFELEATACAEMWLRRNR